jgi:hypothetical protein
VGRDHIARLPRDLSCIFINEKPDFTNSQSKFPILVKRTHRQECARDQVSEGTGQCYRLAAQRIRVIVFKSRIDGRLQVARSVDHPLAKLYVENIDTRSPNDMPMARVNI